MKTSASERVGPSDVCDLLQVVDPTGLPDFHALEQLLASADMEAVRAADQAALRSFAARWLQASETFWSAVAKCECARNLKIPRDLARQRLRSAAAEAPYSYWLQLADSPSQGLALCLLDEARKLVVDAAPVQAPTGTGKTQLFVSHAVSSRAVNLLRLLTASPGQPILERIKEAFDLTNREIAGMFGVTQTAIAQWLQDGVPVKRQAKAVTVIEVADILGYRLKPGRLPGVARKSATAYGGRSMLDMIAADQHGELLEDVRNSFDYARPA